VIKLLRDSSHEIIVFSDPQSSEMSRSFAESNNVRILDGDVRDAAKIERALFAERPNAVIHLAALTGLKKCHDDPALAFSTNVFGTYNVAIGCAAATAKLIFISSREVYGESGVPTPEDAPPSPINTYGLTKLLGEHLILWASSRLGLDYAILRLTNVYGPGGDQYNIQAMIRDALVAGKISVLGGDQRMNLVYVDDVARVIQLCLTNPASSKQIFNVGSYDTLSVNEIVSCLVQDLGGSISVERKPMRPGETLNFEPDLRKIQRTLGYSPSTSFTSGLRKTIQWYKRSVSSGDVHKDDMGRGKND
jgi:UDP-glucose 4-epimerase